MTVFEAIKNYTEAQDALTVALNEWNKALEQFVEETFPNVVTINYRGKEYTGMIKTKQSSGFGARLSDIVFFPLKKNGELSKNNLSLPCIFSFQINRTGNYENLKCLVEKEFGLIGGDE